MEGVEVGKAGKNGGAIPTGEIGLWPPGVNARLFLFASIAAAAAAAFFMADANLKMELYSTFLKSKLVKAIISIFLILNWFIQQTYPGNGKMFCC